MSLRNAAVVAGLLTVPLLTAAPAAADNGVCESMDWGGPWIEVCLKVRGSVTDGVYSVTTEDQKPTRMSGKVVFFALMDGPESSQRGTSPNFTIQLGNGFPGIRTTFGCGGSRNGVWRLGADLCQPWPTDGSLRFKARRYDGAGNLIDELTSSSFDIEAASK